jgi:hypothetical protein
MTTPRNTYLTPTNDRRNYPVTTDKVINEGDACYWDATNYSASPCTSSSNVNGVFLGVAETTTPVTLYGEAGTLTSVAVRRTGCYKFATTNGETYYPNDAVTIGADAQTVIKSGAATTNIIGRVRVPEPTPARAHQATPTPESVSGAAGVYVEVVLRQAASDW